MMDCSVPSGDGAIVGMLGFIIHDHFISGEKVAGEVFWWMEPEHRGDGLKLLDETKRDELKASWGQVSAHSDCPGAKEFPRLMTRSSAMSGSKQRFR